MASIPNKQQSPLLPLSIPLLLEWFQIQPTGPSRGFLKDAAKWDNIMGGWSQGLNSSPTLAAMQESMQQDDWSKFEVLLSHVEQCALMFESLRTAAGVSVDDIPPLL